MSKKGTIFELEMSFGGSYRKMSELKQTKEGKEIYVVIPLLKNGLHITFHNSGEIHIKDNSGFVELIENPANIYSSTKELISDNPFLYHPESREVVVIPTSLRYASPENCGLTLRNRKIQIDMFELSSSISFSEPQLMDASLLKTIPDKSYVAFDPVERKMIFPTKKFMWAVPLDSDMDFIFKSILQTKVGGWLFKPLWKYFEERPGLLQDIDKCFPTVPSNFNERVKKQMEKRQYELEKLEKKVQFLL